MQWRRNKLGEHVNDVVVRVGAVVEVGAESVLPFLCRDLAPRIRSMENESLELQLANALNLGSDFESHVSVSFIGIGPFNETYFGVEVCPDLSTLGNSVEPVRSVRQGSTDVAGSAACSAYVYRGLLSRHVGIHKPVLEENKAGIHTARLIVAIEH